MERVLLGIPLSKEIQNEIERICFGVPNIEWLEPESMHITVKHLGNIQGDTLLDIKEALRELHFPPFEYLLEGLTVRHNKHKNGSLQIPVTTQTHFESLIKEVNKRLKPLNIDQSKQSNNYHVTIGYFHQLRTEHLTNFIEANAYFKSSQCLAEELCILFHHRTPKHTFYTIEETFPFSEGTNSIEDTSHFEVPRSYLPKKNT